MRHLLALAILAAATSPATSAECPLDRIEAALASSTAGLRQLDRDVTDVQSTEGGIWQIFREKDGRVHSIIRIDAGESGRSEFRLSVVNRKSYGIAATRIDYVRHAFIEDAGPNAIVRRTTDYYFFCNGELFLPPRNFSTVDLDAYRGNGQEIQKMMLTDKDIASFTKGLAR